MRLPVFNTARALPARRSLNLFRRARPQSFSRRQSLAYPLVTSCPRLYRQSSTPACCGAASFAITERQSSLDKNLLAFADQLAEAFSADRLSFSSGFSSGFSNLSASSRSVDEVARAVALTSLSYDEGDFSFQPAAAPCVSYDEAPAAAGRAASLDQVVLPESQPVTKEQRKCNGPNLQMLPGVIASSLLAILGSIPEFAGQLGIGTDGAAVAAALASYSPFAVGQCLASHGLPKGIHVQNAPPLTDDVSMVNATPVAVLTAIAEEAANPAAIEAVTEAAIPSSPFAAVAENNSGSTLRAEHFLASVTSRMQRGESLPDAVRMLSTHLNEREMKNVLQGLLDLSEASQDLAVCLAQPPEMTEPDAEADVPSLMNSLRGNSSNERMAVPGSRQGSQRSQGRRSAESPRPDTGLFVM